MGAETRAVKVNGMDATAMKVRGNWYVDVNNMSRLANASGGYSILDEHVFEVNGKYFIRVTIEVLGKNGAVLRKCGTSEIKFGAPRGTADGESPMECAETSAVGRALSFAGFGDIDGVNDTGMASADDMQRVVQHEQVRERRTSSSPTPIAHAPTTKPGSPEGELANERQVSSIRKLCLALKRNEPDFDTLSFEDAKVLMTELSRAFSESRKAG